MKNSETRPFDLLREEARPQWGDRIRNRLSIRRLWNVGPNIESVEEFERLLRLTSRTVGLKTGLPDEEELLDLLKKEDWGIPSAITRKLKEAEDATGYLKFIVRSLQNEDATVRGNAATALGLSGQFPPEVVNPLISALRDQSPEVRWSAAEALGHLQSPSPEVVSALIWACDDKEWLVRGTVVWALGKLGQPSRQVIDTMVEALTDSAGLVREQAIGALARLAYSSPEVVNALVFALRDDDSDVRSSALQALGILGDASPERVVKILQAALSKEEDQTIRGEIESVITRIKNKET